ncbi:PIG-L family deacetylase [Algoriphagus sp. CAU 1675]|uniref:PIG-L family deacetylase n=1 Tax=Algoriphagus sp. CAU 1675 TaxID=3032597 RepID=UPI0023DB3FE6|nr:PIG-L family deacetylase [Algoriphagus sp. CAU 1675]MDF2157695.1 PIG-L family deacetylase [Algoriphagus sp. CAU 1675]
MIKNLRLIVIGLVFWGLFNPFAHAQSLTSSELFHQLLKLKETKRVLYVAAHPDDENTRLIAYLANEERVQVAYLSLTRGDGGQNLIGPELGIGLGQIRTQELLKARETDGGRQFFTRAKDFGYSKNPDETLGNWEKQTILSDVVWVIRSFQPDIIITRFNTTPGVTHGHHTTSAILAEEAFNLAGDSLAFPEQLKYVSTWAPKRIFWNAYNFRGEFVPLEGEIYHEFPTGSFNFLLGESYSQIAADSRTMHKSQGFGATPEIGAAVDHIQFLKGAQFESSPFDGVEDRWKNIAGGEEAKALIQKLIGDFDFVNPSNNYPQLVEIRKIIHGLKSSEPWLKEKREGIDRLLMQSLGLDMEFNVKKETGFPGSDVRGELVLNNPSLIPVEDLSFEIFGQKLSFEDQKAASNEPVKEMVDFSLPIDIPYSQPYWLKEYKDGPMYPISNQLEIGKPFNEPSVSGILKFSVSGEEFQVTLPLMYKYNDQVDGEVKQPFSVVPKIDLNVSKSTVFLVEGADPSIVVTVNFRDKMENGELDFEGIDASQYKIESVEDVPFQKKRVYRVSFLPNGNGKKVITARYSTSEGKAFDWSTNRISYKHIPNLTYFLPASFNLIQEDWKVSGKEIGYIPGAGDEVPQVLEALGYPVTFINSGDYHVEYLNKFKAIVVGIRAYNTNEDLAANQQAVMGYVKAGGNLIVQYNTSSPLLTSQLGPFDFTISRNRVAVQDTPVIADYSDPILSNPNQITASDFEEWVQERGLYFASNMDENFFSPLSMQDPGEEASKGSLIYANYGQGKFFYTGISFFRQLPAGVPGAIKLFINLIEQ